VLPAAGCLRKGWGRVVRRHVHQSLNINSINPFLHPFLNYAAPPDNSSQQLKLSRNAKPPPGGPLPRPPPPPPRTSEPYVGMLYMLPACGPLPPKPGSKRAWNLQHDTNIHMATTTRQAAGKQHQQPAADGVLLCGVVSCRSCIAWQLLLLLLPANRHTQTSRHCVDRVSCVICWQYSCCPVLTPPPPHVQV